VPGYGILPYAYVEQYWIDAYAIDTIMAGSKELPSRKKGASLKQKGLAAAKKRSRK
jgi:hypothetical protein